MKKIYLVMLLLAPVMSFSQAPDSTADKKNEFTASANYQSNLHYFGRVDSLRSSGLFPIIGYQLKNGLYVQGTAVFVQNPATPFTYTGASAELGYKFPESEHFEGNIFVSKFFYKDQSVLVQSALQAQTGVNVSYKNKILNFNLGGDLKFSERTDVGATVGIDHLFVKRIEGWDKSAVAIMPSVTINAGTQNFSQTYIEKTNVWGVPVTRQRTEKVERFNILSYEFSAPVVLVVGKMNAYVVPSYVMPQNLLADIEKGENLFYVTLGLGIRL
jgi:opacity protein-like surface antigen